MERQSVLHTWAVKMLAQADRLPKQRVYDGFVVLV